MEAVCATTAMAQTYTIRTLGDPPYPPSFSSVGKAVNNKDEVLADGVFGPYNGTPSIFLPAPDYGMAAGLDYLPFFGYTNFTGRQSIFGISFTSGYSTTPYPRVINDRGQVYGSLNSPAHAAYWQNQHVTDLGTLGGTNSVPFALNERGDFVGYSTIAPNNAFMQPFIVYAESNVMQAIPGTSSQQKLIGFNNQRQIILTSASTNGSGFDIWQNGTAQDLMEYLHVNPGPPPNIGPLPGDTNIIGIISYPDGTYHGIVPLALNDAGEIFGLYLTQVYVNNQSIENLRQTFIYSPNGGNNLNPGMNLDPANFGDLYFPGGYCPIISWNTNGQFLFIRGGLNQIGSDAGFYLWNKGRQQTFQSLVPPQYPWTSLMPFGINDNGDIVGQGMLNGSLQGFLLYFPGLTVSLTATPSTNIFTGDVITIVATAINQSTKPLTNVQFSLPITLSGTGGAAPQSTPAEPAPAILDPGEQITYTQVFNATKIGSVQFGAGASWIDSQGATQSVSALSLPISVLSPLSLSLNSFPSARVNKGNTIDVSAIVINLSHTNTVLTGVQLTGPLSTSGAGGVQLQSGPLPPGAVTLNPGDLFTFTNHYLATNYGPVTFSGTATGFDPANTQDFASATNTPMMIAPGGDLLIKRDVEPNYFGFLNFQTTPAGLQIRTNMLSSDPSSKFQIQINNNDPQPQTFTLTAKRVAKAGWTNSYLINGEDMTAQLESPGGATLPEMAAGDSTIVTVIMRATNAPPSDIQRIDFNLGLASDPSLILDAVETVTVNAAPVIVGHVYCVCSSNGLADASVLIGTNLITADLEGSYYWSNVPPATYTEVVSATNHATLTNSLTVDGTQSIITNDFYLTNTTFVIGMTLDSSITGLYGAETISNSIYEATQVYTHYIADPICVKILFYGTDQGLGVSRTPKQQLTYLQYLTDLGGITNRSANDYAAMATLNPPPNTGVNSNTVVLLTAANLEVLGEQTLANAAKNQFSGFNSVIGFNFSILNNTRPGLNPNNYDLISTASHEIDEVLGIGGNGSTLRLDAAYAGDPAPTNGIGTLDVYRYGAPGVRSFSLSPTNSAYFSINGGTNVLVFFNQFGPGSDFGDWNTDKIPQNAEGNNPSQVQDAFGTPGTMEDLGANELIALDIIGYTLIGSSSIQGLAYSNRTFSATVSTVPGQTYQMQTASSFAPGAWHNVGPTFVAGGVTTTFTDPNATSSAQYYRAYSVTPNQPAIRPRSRPEISVPLSDGEISIHHYLPKRP